MEAPSPVRGAAAFTVPGRSVELLRSWHSDGIFTPLEVPLEDWHLVGQAGVWCANLEAMLLARRSAVRFWQIRAIRSGLSHYATLPLLGVRRELLRRLGSLSAAWR